MVKKISKKYIYKGLGFSVELHDVEMIKIHNEWHPNIDVRSVAEKTMQELAFQTERFTGNQVKFIRSFLSMTMRDFAKNVVRESHTAVNNWEKCGNKVSTMDINIERILRLYIFQKVCKKTSKQKNEFYDRLLEPSSISSEKQTSHLQLHV